ncbi:MULTISPECIES: malate synthase G [Salimicrobium]|uniref:Malate synthase G n=1 Tax=Salimicrobium humidisoli TaxID=2029857 RepID=A0ABX4HTW2_9BACI|nr:MULTISPECIES: malate synthase G [Salimicrobium]PBB06672.1 malate synthase G [Salimicrobium humidisoli]
MGNYQSIGTYQIDTVLYQFIEQEVLPGLPLSSKEVWRGLTEILDEFTPENIRLLQTRKQLQQKIDEYHKSASNEDYLSFLKSIGYLEEKKPDFKISTTNVDSEMKEQAGPQLVVPLTNERYSLNAANARWGSMYDAYYGTDLIPEEPGIEKGASYNPERGKEVIKQGRMRLDEWFPLAEGSHQDAVRYAVVNGELCVELTDRSRKKLKNPSSFLGCQGDCRKPQAILLKHNDLHVELQFDRNHPVGQIDDAGIKDIQLESAITSIMDCEDSVACVDAEDKTKAYRNWLGLLKGDLTTTFDKNGETIKRSLHKDRKYRTAEDEELHLKGRALMLVRNVGHLMTNPAVIDNNNNPVHEGLLDGFFTSLIGMHDLNLRQNSTEGSIYIVKPKMHGSEETAFTNNLFNRIEDVLQLPRYTLKVGVMDEERRTSLNLHNCIYEVRNRVVFINTGFLDRTGDEIHTSMEKGPMIPKGEMKGSEWLSAYEASNVRTGIRAGFIKNAQIGKGMWAKPTEMKAMLAEKINHLKAGGNTAWVPSPTAATIHAMHYHEAYVPDIQNDIPTDDPSEMMLNIPVASPPEDKEVVLNEVRNNAQGILGYVVRWVEQGIGCSTVPDIHDTGLMEDRATLRISSQHIANWIRHGVVSEEEVKQIMKQMAEVVDRQNEGDPNYRKMSPDFEQSIAFQAASDLVFLGTDQPNGYTEPILHRRRLQFKASQFTKTV